MTVFCTAPYLEGLHVECIIDGREYGDGLVVGRQRTLERVALRQQTWITASSQSPLLKQHDAKPCCLSSVHQGLPSRFG